MAVTKGTFASLQRCPLSFPKLMAHKTTISLHRGSLPAWLCGKSYDIVRVTNFYTSIMPPFFKSKKISSETLGEYLRDTRTTLKFTLAQVWRLTQIPEKFLADLEEGAYEKLPDDVYVRGFLQSLAAVYKISTDSLLRQFERERVVDRSLKKDPLAPHASSRTRIPRAIITPRTFTIALVIVLACASLGYLVWQVRSVSAPPKLSITTPSSDMTVSSRSIVLRGETEPGSKLFINGQEVLVEETGAFTETLNLAEGVNNVAVKSQNKFGRSSQVNRVIIVTPEQMTSATSTNALALIELKVVVGPKPAWIKVVSDGQVIQDGVIAGGGEVLVKAEKELLLSTDDAGSTSVIYKGRDLGVLGAEGQKLTDIKFTP